MHSKYNSPESAVQLVNSNQRVFIQGSAATPTLLIHELAKRKEELKNVEPVSISTFRSMPMAEEAYGENLRVRAEALRAIAHTDHREKLDEAIFERFRKKMF